METSHFTFMNMSTLKYIENILSWPLVNLNFIFVSFMNNLVPNLYSAAVQPNKMKTGKSFPPPKILQCLLKSTIRILRNISIFRQPVAMKNRSTAILLRWTEDLQLVLVG